MTVREVSVGVGVRGFLGKVAGSCLDFQLFSVDGDFERMVFAIGFLIAGEAGEKVLSPTIEIGITLLWLSAIVTLYTGWDYLRAGLRYMIDE